MKEYKTADGYDALWYDYHKCFFIADKFGETIGKTYPAGNSFWTMLPMYTTEQLRNITDLITQIQNS